MVSQKEILTELFRLYSKKRRPGQEGEKLLGSLLHAVSDKDDWLKRMRATEGCVTIVYKLGENSYAAIAVVAKIKENATAVWIAYQSDYPLNGQSFQNGQNAWARAAEAAKGNGFSSIDDMTSSNPLAEGTAALDVLREAMFGNGRSEITHFVHSTLKSRFPEQFEYARNLAATSPAH